MARDSDSREAQPNGNAYRFDRLRLGLVLRDLYFTKTDPGPGERMVDFDLPTLDGGRFRSQDLSETAPVLMVFGSYTCPVTESAAPGLRHLHARFGDRVPFVMVNVREAHPGANVPQPNSMEEKQAHAGLLRDLHDLTFDIAVDDIAGSLHRAMSPKPNSAYLLGSDGSILFRAHWANATRALAAALEDVTAGRPRARSGRPCSSWRQSSIELAPAPGETCGWLCRRWQLPHGFFDCFRSEGRGVVLDGTSSTPK